MVKNLNIKFYKFYIIKCEKREKKMIFGTRKNVYKYFRQPKESLLEEV